MKNLKCRLIMFVLLVGLVFSGYKIVDYFYTSYDEKQNFNNVEKLVESEYEDEKIQYNDFEILKKYKKVYEKNNDLVCLKCSVTQQTFVLKLRDVVTTPCSLINTSRFRKTYRKKFCLQKQNNVRKIIGCAAVKGCTA